MGLIFRALVAKLRRVSTAVFIGTLWWGGCVQPIAFDEVEESAYLFVEGAVDVGQEAQRIRVGRTDGAGRDGSEPIDGTVVRLTDLTDAEEVDCRDLSDGTFDCRLAGRFDHIYRLEVDVPELGTYAAETGPLAAADLNLTFETGLEIRRRPDGSEVEAPVAVVDVFYDAPADVDWTLLTRPSFTWAYTDRAEGFLDPALTCYFDAGAIEGFSVVDVAGQSPGSRAFTRAARVPLDFRTSGASVLSAEVMRVPGVAQRYYRDLAVATNLSGSIFSERPYSTAGNMEAPAGAPAMLGYFAVRDREVLHAPLTSDELRRQTPPPVCANFNTSFPQGIDCVNCLLSNVDLYGEPTTVRPPFWP